MPEQKPPEAEIIPHPSKLSNRALGAICALGALGAFGAENIAWCEEILSLFIYNDRAREYREKTGKQVQPDTFFEFLAEFDASNFLNTEQIQALNKLGAFRALPCAFRALLVRFRALSKNQDQLIENIRHWVNEASGAFSNSQIYSDLGATHPEIKKRVRAELSRLTKDKVIERGDKNGQYRKVDSETVEMDFVNAPDETVPIFWPLGIGHHAKIMPGNVIVVAGTTNAGKTGFLLNVVNDNDRNFDIHYFSSEMGPSEFKQRLQCFDRPITSWKHHAYERSHDFHDVIRPGRGRINIIDYYEIDDEYWKISGAIRKIWERLDGAIAIIALQKKHGTEYGAGGMKSAEKARLYLSMSPNRIKFSKVKSWVNPEDNPNGKVLEYKLRSGCHFSVVRDWHREEK